MSLEYAPRGLVGMLTPQANTTVEPEFNLLWPPGVAMLNARLMSDKPTIPERLVDYVANYGNSLRQFANAPIGVAAAASTGASYLAGIEREATMVREISAKAGFPFTTAALATVDALRALKATRIGFVSPYPDDLNKAGIGYWQGQGFEIAELAGVFNTESAFHPIYSLAGSATIQALRELERKPIDAIVMLGTGLPTLWPLAELMENWTGPPAMSCNLCLAWRAVEYLDGVAPSRDTLEPWIRGDGWVARLKAHAVIPPSPRTV